MRIRSLVVLLFCVLCATPFLLLFSSRNSPTELPNWAGSWSKKLLKFSSELKFSFAFNSTSQLLLLRIPKFSQKLFRKLSIKIKCIEHQFKQIFDKTHCL